MFAKAAGARSMVPEIVGGGQAGTLAAAIRIRTGVAKRSAQVRRLQCVGKNRYQLVSKARPGIAARCPRGDSWYRVGAGERPCGVSIADLGSQSR